MLLLLMGLLVLSERSRVCLSSHSLLLRVLRVLLLLLLNLRLLDLSRLLLRHRSLVERLWLLLLRCRSLLLLLLLRLFCRGSGIDTSKQVERAELYADFVDVRCRSGHNDSCIPVLWLGRSLSESWRSSCGNFGLLTGKCGRLLESRLLRRQSIGSWSVYVQRASRVASERWNGLFCPLVLSDIDRRGVLGDNSIGPAFSDRQSGWL